MFISGSSVSNIIVCVAFERSEGGERNLRLRKEETPAPARPPSPLEDGQGRDSFYLERRATNGKSDIDARPSSSSSDLYFLSKFTFLSFSDLENAISHFWALGEIWLLWLRVAFDSVTSNVRNMTLGN